MKGSRLPLFFGCLLLTLGLFLSGCQSHNSEVNTPAPRSYLSFLRYDDTVQVYVDGQLMPALGVDDDGKPVLLEVTPGRHEVVVSRGGREVVRRTVFLGNGQNLEILIP